MACHRLLSCGFARAIGVALAFVAPIAARAELAISAQATNNVSCANDVCTATAAHAVLNADELQGMLASSNVTVATGACTDDIVVAAPFGWPSTSRLTLDAMRSVTIDRPVGVAGSGGLAIVTNDGGINGRFSFGATGDVTFAQLDSALAINGTNYTLEGSIGALASAIAANPSGAYALANSYNAKGDGTYTSSPVPTRFMGSFEGLGNAISHLSLKDNHDVNIGLFADVGSAGTLADIRLVGAKVVARTPQSAVPVGALAGLNEGTILDASTTGAVSGSGQLGAAYASLGGLAGDNEGSIAYSRAGVDVTGGPSTFVGGLVGNAGSGNIYASSSTGSVTGGQGSEAGGLVGANGGKISQSFATGAVGTQPESKVGGLVGFDSGPIDDSYATGAAAQASVLGYSGGLVGFFQPEGTNILTRDYSTGTVSGGNFDGGLIGLDNSSGVNLAFDDWNMTTSGITDPSGGAGFPANDPGIKGLSSRQLRAHLPHGFQRSTWAEDSRINQGFPYLRVNPPGR